MLHRGDRRTLTTKKVRETEAEAVAFVVCNAVGLHNGTSSQDYVVFVVMLSWWCKGACLLGISCLEHNISKDVIVLGVATATKRLGAPLRNESGLVFHMLGVTAATFDRVMMYGLLLQPIMTKKEIWPACPYQHSGLSHHHVRV